MEIKIGDKFVGLGHPAFIVAEMSANHGGSLERALSIIEEAKKIGADAIKIQTYTADTITLNSNSEDFKIPTNNPWAKESTLHDLYSKAYTPWEWHQALFDKAKELNIVLFSSPFDESSVDFLEQFDIPAYKIASPEITHIPLLKKVAQTNKPIIFSTGVAEAADIDLALDTLRSYGCNEIIILKCTSSYPTLPKSINLKTMQNYCERFGCLSGISDHTLGTAVSVAAVALGASMVEKHFIIDKDEYSQDGFFSLDRQEFQQLVSDIRVCEQALGHVDYELNEDAARNKWGRRSLYISTDVKRGDIITPKNIKCVRPHFGIHPKYWDQVMGKSFKKDLNKGARLNHDDVE